jgi:alpha(1,3/1,4) fucosyltransferase
MTVKIGTVDFWDGFNIKNHILGYLLERAGFHGYVLVKNPTDADIIFKSGSGSTRTDPMKTIFYTGENSRPDFLHCRYALSFDRDDWSGRNLYFPNWMGRLNWPNYKRTKNSTHPAHHWENLIDPAVLTTPRPLTSELYDKQFCAIVAYAYEGLRVSLTAGLNDYRKVNARGRLFGNPLNQSKHDFFRSYKFVLCPENSFFPGYVTEKLFDAWVGGAVPLYFGGSGADSTINSKAFVNYANFFNATQFIKKVISLDQSKEAYAEVYHEPLLLNAPDINPAIAFVHDAVKTICSI